MTDKIYGIDLGTTNSCLATLEDIPRVIPIDGNGIVPSVVSFDGSEILVGRRALNRSLAFPEQSVRSIKRLMGSGETVKIGEKSYKPEEISAMILGYLRDESKKLEGIEVKRVVITVPAYFSEAQRRATLTAGELAGLKVERIINEPTAAALFYDLIKVSTHDGTAAAKDSRYSVVYDLGGGTFDVSVLRMGDITEVMSSTGDTHLGGDDFDLCLAKYLLERMGLPNSDEFLRHRPSMARLISIAEKAKIELSTRGTTLVEETMIPGPKRSDYSISETIIQGQFEEMTKDLIDKSLILTEKAINEAGLQPTDIDQVLLVGGMTRMPIISRKLADIFGDAQLPTVDPDLSVANGAAVQGGIITGENVEKILVDVTSHTLSLMANDYNVAKCIPIIPRNTPIPATRSHLFYSGIPNQKMGLLAVFQGESDLPKDNEFIGSTPFYLNSVNNLSRIEVEFSYDSNGMIHLVAEQKGQKRKIAIDLDSRNPYSDAGTITGWSDLPGSGRKLFDDFFDDDDDDDDEDLEKRNSPVADFDEDEDDASESSPEADLQLNFVLKRAYNLLASLEDSQEKATLTDLTKRYKAAILEDSDDLDNLEDELLNFIENKE
ncbi:MAG: Hsp70 family protein [Deltaproteobacteria bacterium]|jgi:molecular chaperone DnaK|nr:Hsp70 family protein [Deltaproteobacteria bacterium]